MGDATEQDGKFPEQTFGSNRLAVENCVSINIHPPKVDDFEGYFFIVVHGVNHSVITEVVETAEDIEEPVMYHPQKRFPK